MNLVVAAKMDSLYLPGSPMSAPPISLISLVVPLLLIQGPG